MANQIREETKFKIVGFLQGSKPCSATFIKDSLMIDFDSVATILEEFLKENKIRRIETATGILYEWIK